MLKRHGTALLELLLAIVLASLALTVATSSLLRQQRVHGRIRSHAGADGQLHSAATVLAAQLAELDAAAGDITSGSASDTALQFRASVAVSFACEKSAGSVSMLPDVGPGGAYAGTASPARAGDTLWWLGDSAWSAARVRSVEALTVTCAVPLAFTGSSVRLVLANADDSIPAGAPLRLTRQTRYSLYRSGDGSWQLGFREWNEATGAFPAPQPVAGPLLLAVGARRSGYRYFDTTGAEIATGGGALDVTRIARIRITMRSLVTSGDRGADSVRTDSIDVGLRRGGT